MTRSPKLPRPVVPASAPDALSVTLQIPRETVDAIVALLRSMQTELVDDLSRGPRLLSEEQCAADVLRVCSRTIRDRLLPEGIPYHDVSGMRRYDPDEVLQWLRARRAAANAQATPAPAKATPRPRARRRPAGGTP